MSPKAPVIRPREDLSGLEGGLSGLEDVRKQASLLWAAFITEKAASKKQFVCFGALMHT
jgi:hypothetical protein